MRSSWIWRAALVSLCVIVAALQIARTPAYGDVDDQTQVLMLTNFLLTGTYGLPQQPQVQLMAIYHNYALVQLNAPLPPAQTVPAPQPTDSSPSGAAPAGSPSAVTSPTAQPSAGARSGPSSYVAFKTHRSWIFQFSKTGAYSQADLVAAGIPQDVAVGLLQFLKPPAPAPSP
jgi:hypothetical protein